MSKITIFKSWKDTDNPIHIDIQTVLSRIRHPNKDIVHLIKNIRSESDPKRRKRLKDNLPCIVFSGIFSRRADSAMEEHSGYAVFDFDHVGDPKMLKDKLKAIDYIYTAFVSPSGDGVKALAKIPKSIKHHRENYEQVNNDLSARLKIPNSQMDKTSINESRICYTSHDSDIYISTQCKTFQPKNIRKATVTDYEKVSVAVNMIQLAPDGSKHGELIKASYLMGGYIASGLVDESIATTALEAAIKSRNIDSFESAKKTIADGIRKGKELPISDVRDIEYSANLNKLRILVSDPRRKYEFLTDRIDDDDDLDRYRNNGFKMGELTGYIDFDRHFRFKEGEFNAILGHANVGKSFFMWWLMVLAAVKLDWSWLVYSTENKVRQVKKKIMEFYAQQSITEMSESVYKESKEWMNNHFTFIRIDRGYTAFELLDFASLLLKEKEYKGFMVDPYNTLDHDEKVLSKYKGNIHQYDYHVASKFVSFADQNNISIYVNAHAVTEAARYTYPQGHAFAGYIKPPHASHIEGGGKWVNRVTGFFITVHRFLNHPELKGETRVDINKVKDVETGGMPTSYENPIKFKLKDMNYFVEVNYPRHNPIEHAQHREARNVEIDYDYSINNDDESPF